jgi:hypothetical protein
MERPSGFPIVANRLLLGPAGLLPVAQRRGARREVTRNAAADRRLLAQMPEPTEHHASGRLMGIWQTAAVHTKEKTLDVRS